MSCAPSRLPQADRVGEEQEPEGVQGVEWGEWGPSGAKTSSTFTNNAPTPSARAPIQSSRVRRSHRGLGRRSEPSAALPASAHPELSLLAIASTP